MMKKAVFLDRDGVINRKGGSYYISREEDFFFNNGVTEALKYFTDKGYLLIVITNQGGIAKGLFTNGHLEKLHNFMSERLADSGINLTAIYYCPHHPDISMCDCRKPGSLLFEKAISEHNIDRGSSFMIGDSLIDIQASENAGIKGILIPTNGNMMDLVIKTGLI
jgi:D-glycero-D-manno-heptose 1,7-bisphosphate phosphatase